MSSQRPNNDSEEVAHQLGDTAVVEQSAIEESPKENNPPVSKEDKFTATRAHRQGRVLFKEDSISKINTGANVPANVNPLFILDEEDEDEEEEIPDLIDPPVVEQTESKGEGTGVKDGPPFVIVDNEEKVARLAESEPSEVAKGERVDGSPPFVIADDNEEKVARLAESEHSEVAKGERVDGSPPFVIVDDNEETPSPELVKMRVLLNHASYMSSSDEEESVVAPVKSKSIMVKDAGNAPVMDTQGKRDMEATQMPTATQTPKETDTLVSTRGNAQVGDGRMRLRKRGMPCTEMAETQMPAKKAKKED